MEYRHILNVALTRYIEYVCIPLHSYHGIQTYSKCSADALHRICLYSIAFIPP